MSDLRPALSFLSMSRYLSSLFIACCSASLFLRISTSILVEIFLSRLISFLSAKTSAFAVDEELEELLDAPLEEVVV